MSSPELPEHPREGRLVSPEATEAALVRKPQIGDTRPAPIMPVAPPTDSAPATSKKENPIRRNRQKNSNQSGESSESSDNQDHEKSGRRNRRGGRNRRRRTGSDRDSSRPNSPVVVETDAELIERRRGKERNGRPLGRYMMVVQARKEFTQVAMLEGRSLIEHYVSRPADDSEQIHGNIYLGRVQNVLPGMEAAFVDIGTPKNAVLYRGDVQFDKEDVVEQGPEPRIEHVLQARQLILCQVTKNPIGSKGGRLTQEVSLPGRFVVLIPDSRTYGISKRLPDDERRRLRSILDRVKPDEHEIGRAHV